MCLVLNLGFCCRKYIYEWIGLVVVMLFWGWYCVNWESEVWWCYYGFGEGFVKISFGNFMDVDWFWVSVVVFIVLVYERGELICVSG